MALKLWVVLVSGVLGGLAGVVVYILAVFGPHYPPMFWFSVGVGIVAGLLTAWFVLVSR